MFRGSEQVGPYVVIQTDITTTRGDTLIWDIQNLKKISVTAGAVVTDTTVIGLSGNQHTWQYASGPTILVRLTGKPNQPGAYHTYYDPRHRLDVYQATTVKIGAVNDTTEYNTRRDSMSVTAYNARVYKFVSSYNTVLKENIHSVQMRTPLAMPAQYPIRLEAGETVYASVVQDSLKHKLKYRIRMIEGTDPLMEPLNRMAFTPSYGRDAPTDFAYLKRYIFPLSDEESHERVGCLVGALVPRGSNGQASADTVLFTQVSQMHGPFIAEVPDNDFMFVALLNFPLFNNPQRHVSKNEHESDAFIVDIKIRSVDDTKWIDPRTRIIVP